MAAVPALQSTPMISVVLSGCDATLENNVLTFADEFGALIQPTQYVNACSSLYIKGVREPGEDAMVNIRAVQLVRIATAFTLTDNANLVIVGENSCLYGSDVFGLNVCNSTVTSDNARPYVYEGIAVKVSGARSIVNLPNFSGGAVDISVKQRAQIQNIVVTDTLSVDIADSYTQCAVTVAHTVNKVTLTHCYADPGAVAFITHARRHVVLPCTACPEARCAMQSSPCGTYGEDSTCAQPCSKSVREHTRAWRLRRNTLTANQLALVPRAPPLPVAVELGNLFAEPLHCRFALTKGSFLAQVHRGAVLMQTMFVLHRRRALTSLHGMVAEYGEYKAKAQAEPETTCVVCLDRPRDVLLLPCRHFSICGVCSAQIRDRCPVCRRTITERVECFL